MATDVEIANMCLANVGVDVTISALDEEGSAEARLCNRFITIAKQFTLRDVDMPFSKRYMQLQLVGEDPNPDWAYSYRYPNDCLKARYIVNETLGLDERHPQPYEVAGDDTGSLILTDKEDAMLCYTMDITNSARFDPMFAVLVSWRLSVHVGPPLSSIKDVAKYADENYMIHRSVCLAAALNEQKYKGLQEAEWVSQR